MGIENFGKIDRWSNWRIDYPNSEGKDAFLGEGSYGKVYRVVRKEDGITSGKSAIKVISVPSDMKELRKALLDANNNEAVVKEYFKDIVDTHTEEIKHMHVLKGHSNIVNIEDYEVLEKTDAIGWDIFIKMELLTSLDEYLIEKQPDKLSESEVISLGRDILNALELCSQLVPPIIHRDVKPENIFYKPMRGFILGDFSIARELRKPDEYMSSGVGTPNYRAPEIENSEPYDARIDTYSLGLILYRILNNNRLPFLDPKKHISRDDEWFAYRRRISGRFSPAPPCEASEAMARVIHKACSFDPEDRFQSPTEFKNALDDVPVRSPITQIIPDTKTEELELTQETELEQVQETELNLTNDFQKTFRGRRLPEQSLAQSEDTDSYLLPSTSDDKVSDDIKKALPATSKNEKGVQFVIDLIVPVMAFFIVLAFLAFIAAYYFGIDVPELFQQLFSY